MKAVPADELEAKQLEIQQKRDELLVELAQIVKSRVGATLHAQGSTELIRRVRAIQSQIRSCERTLKILNILREQDEKKAASATT